MVSDEERLSAIRRSLLLARIGIVAWAIVLVAAVVLALQQPSPWLGVVLAAFAVLRLVLDVRRLRVILRALAEEDED